MLARTINSGSTKPGLHRVLWNMVRGTDDGKKGGGGMGGKGGKGGAGGGGGGFGGGKGGPGGPAAIRPIPPGTYRVVLFVDGQEFTSVVRIEADPNVPPRPDGADDEEQLIDPRKIN